MQILTFVTPNGTPEFDVWIKKSHPDIVIEDRRVLEAARAVQWVVREPLSKPTLDAIRREFRVDVIQQNATHRDIHLFLADMDATIVRGETLDDMAQKAGIGDQISAITARAMAGELNFESALLERVGLLAGLSVDIIDEALAEMQLNDGADELLRHLKGKNVYCVLISGGFTQFTGHIAARLGFDAHFGNELVIGAGQLTGDVKRPIVGKDFKRQTLDELAGSMGFTMHQTMAIGDGANDLPMLQGAGLGVGYYPKPLLKESLINTIEYTDLSSLIYVLGD